MGIGREGSGSAPLIRPRRLIGKEETCVGLGSRTPHPLGTEQRAPAAGRRGETKGKCAETFGSLLARSPTFASVAPHQLDS